MQQLLEIFDAALLGVVPSGVALLALLRELLFQGLGETIHGLVIRVWQHNRLPQGIRPKLYGEFV